jgi:signal transduction histidine kinase
VKPFRSIRWRLVTSYVLLTLLTVGVLGALAYSFFLGYVRRGERESLRSNAEAIARQAAPLLYPLRSKEALNELASTASFLGDVRVRILTPKGEVLADSGSPGQVDEYLLVQPPLASFRVGTYSDGFTTFVMKIPSAHPQTLQHAEEMMFAFMSQLPEDTRFDFVQRIPGAWGNRVRFTGVSEMRSDESGVLRSKDPVRVVIGDKQVSLGYVELSEAPSFGGEALRTAGRAFGFAALGAVAVAVLLGLLESRRLTTPIAELTGVTDRMASGDLSVRARVGGRDEISQLAQSVNEMAGRLETNFELLETERDSLRQFIQDASHELRTPITALRNFNELLLSGVAENPATRQEFLGESQTQLERLSWMAESLLSLSRLDASLMPLELESLPAERLLRAAAAPFLALAAKDRVHLSVLEPENLTVLGDRRLLEMALANLIENSLKFSPAGSEIEIGARAEDSQVLLWVRDNGPGIEQQDLPHVFDRFYRGGNAGTSGSGLGLALVRSIARAHGGEAEVESETGVGTQVTLRLPGDPESQSRGNQPG